MSFIWLLIWLFLLEVGIALMVIAWIELTYVWRERPRAVLDIDGHWRARRLIERRNG